MAFSTMFADGKNVSQSTGECISQDGRVRGLGHRIRANSPHHELEVECQLHKVTVLISGAAVTSRARQRGIAPRPGGEGSGTLLVLLCSDCIVRE